MSQLAVGDLAPNFAATTSDGKLIRLSDYIGKKGLVLFFYPKDGSAVCTREACAFRDSYEKFAAAGFEVVGVSADSNESHKDFAAQHRLSFPLISDADGSLRKLFGVQNTLMFIPSRVTFVIDQFGVIQSIYSALLASDNHVQKAIDAVARSATSS